MSMTREDNCKMTREDVLRELELLPVWTLRTPMPTQIIVESAKPVLTVEAENKPTENTIASTAVLIVSDDKKWAFVLDAALTGQAVDLFNNILLALNINHTQTIHTKQLTQDIANLGASMLVAMGETIAQQLLASTQSIAHLRGKIHVVNNMQIMVTFHPDELLQHLPDKAKTWDDLCMAMSRINVQ